MDRFTESQFSAQSPQRRNGNVIDFAAVIVSSGSSVQSSRGGIDMNSEGIAVIIKTWTDRWKSDDTPLACCSPIWHHVVVTWDSEIMDFYINSTLVERRDGDSRDPKPVNEKHHFTVGAFNTGDKKYAEMLFDEMIYLDKFVTKPEVEKIFSFQMYSDGTCHLFFFGISKNNALG